MSGYLSEPPIGFAHRGYAPDGAENTMGAFQNAIDLGFSYIETDVRTSSDGVLMIFHDETLDRVTDATGPISERSASELSNAVVHPNSRIPTLEEALTRWPGIKWNVDLKDDASVPAFAELVTRLDCEDRVLAATFSEARHRTFLRLMTDARRRVATSASMLTLALMVVLGPVGLTRAIARWSRVDCLQVPVRAYGVLIVRKVFIARAHRAGLQVHVWTINDEAAMRELFALGVDGIMTDRADILARVLGLTPRAL